MAKSGKTQGHHFIIIITVIVIITTIGSVVICSSEAGTKQTASHSIRKVTRNKTAQN